MSLEIVRTGRAALFLDGAGAFQLCYRRGDETLQADAGKVIDWFRTTRREEILVTTYRELKAFSRRIRRWHYFPEVSAPALPYLTSRMADGTLFRFLSEADLLSVIGGSRDLQQGPVHGFVHTYLTVVRQARDFYQRISIDPANLNLDQAQKVRGETLSIGDYQADLDRQVTDFRQWLLQQGILPD